MTSDTSDTPDIGRMINGELHITTGEFAAEWNLDPSVLRAAARTGTHGLDKAAVRRGYHKLYPYRLVKAWRDELDAKADGRGDRGTRKDRPLPDIKAVAARYDLDYSLVYRHVANGNLPAWQDPKTKLWYIRGDDAKRWAEEYYGITHAERPEIQPAGY